jgi:hypothetical protein
MASRVRPLGTQRRSSSSSADGGAAEAKGGSQGGGGGGGGGGADGQAVGARRETFYNTGSLDEIFPRELVELLQLGQFPLAVTMHVLLPSKFLVAAQMIQNVMRRRIHGMAAKRADAAATIQVRVL